VIQTRGVKKRKEKKEEEGGWGGGVCRLRVERLSDGCKQRGGDVAVPANGHAGRPGCFFPGASSTGIIN